MLNKNNYLVTSAQENFSKDAPTLNMLPFSSRSSSLVDVQVLVIGFRVSKHTIKRGIIAFKSYLETSQIAFPPPTKFCTTCNDLN